MIEIEGGPYISGGRGEPPITSIADVDPEDYPPERTVDVPTFAMDRTEVSNSAFRMFTSPTSSTVLTMPSYPNTRVFRHAAEPNYPVTQVTWAQAQAYCRFLGKQLPSDAQWEKAMRGGLRVHGAANPMPRRIVPWGNSASVPANVKDVGGEQPAPVGANRGDASPYGVLDLAGNVQEWTRTTLDQGFYATRGCSWSMCTTAMLPLIAVPNARAATFKYFELGFRCALEPDPGRAHP
jgi:formylglycine-generating enzyme required for sulfatase activity